MIGARRRCLLAGKFLRKRPLGFEASVPRGAYRQSARGGRHPKTLARGSAILVNAKRHGVRPALRRFNLERNRTVGRPWTGLWQCEINQSPPGI